MHSRISLIRVTTATIIIIVYTLSLVVSPILLKAQGGIRKSESKKHQNKIRRLVDTSWKSTFNLADTSSVILINRIENINSTLNAFNDVLERGYDTSDIAEELPRYQRNIDLVKFNILSINGGTNLRNLSLLQDMIGDITDELKDWQSSLLSYYTELVGIHTQMRSIAVDSSLRDVVVDSSLRALYLRQFTGLKEKWVATDTITQKIIQRIDKLQSQVSNLYFDASALANKVDDQIKTYSQKVFGNESGYLWRPGGNLGEQGSIESTFLQSLKQTAKVFRYYIRDNWTGRVTAMVLSILFFFWVTVNARRVKKSGVDTLARLKYIRPLPFIASIVFLFALVPFFDLHPPVIIIEITQLFLGIAVTLLLFSRWPKDLFIFWLFFLISYIFHGLAGIMIRNTIFLRYLSLVVELLSICLGLLFIGKIRKYPQFFPRYMPQVAVLYVALNVLAVGCNFFGRVSLSQLFGSTGISSFLQAMGLIIFIQIFLDAIFLQLEADRKSSRFTAYLKYENVELRLRYALTFIATIFWLVTLTENLNIYDATYNFIQEFLNKEHRVGSTSFTFGSVAVFFFVIWIANILQKYIGYFFGETEDEVMPDKKIKLGTSILLIRLLILSTGFFLGILASGIPLDKVTIVIGALGVGIGLGLQNIVNNLVSGVILAIERPIQVGDIVEISSNSGRVKDIGIRSSRIVTADGAEVIIPNGDMLSQKLINWTLSNSHARIVMSIKLASAEALTRAKELILNILEELDKDVMSKPPPQLFTKSLSPDSAELQVMFWVYDINNIDLLQSEVRQKIYDVCLSENIIIHSS